MTTPIIVLLLLVSPLCVALIISRINGVSADVGKYAFWGLGACFVFFAMGHAIKTDGMVQMLPPWVPFRFALVYVTGVIELLIAIALFIPRFQSGAAKAAIVVLVVFFPANIYAAINATGLGGHQWGPIYLLIRFPLQLTLISWAYFLCLKGSHR